MYEQLITIFSSSSVVGVISNHIDMLSGLIDGYLSGIDNLRMASIILMILALILFLFLIIIIYIKTIVAFLRNDPASGISEDEGDDIFDEEDARRLNQIIEDQERERELEKELQKELEMAKAERDLTERQAAEKKAKLNEADALKKKNEEKKKETEAKSHDKESAIDLDWKKGKIRELEEQAAKVEIRPDSLSYHQSNRSLNELMGLIIDMIGRGVDDLKIAQTVMFRNHYLSSEDEVLQLIDGVKDFIGLCRSQNFSQLQSGQMPTAEDALYHLSEGDPTLALAMLEALMDAGIDKASEPGMEHKKDEICREVSAQAVAFGNLAAVNDVHLATGAFELAIELFPQNVTAWSRVADMYTRADTASKAIWAYQSVLNMADGELNAREVANASKNLSQHLYAQGNSLQAAKLYNSSKQYYDSLGINRRLDKQEIEIVEIIESHHQEEIRSTILKLLGREAANMFAYA